MDGLDETSPTDRARATASGPGSELDEACKGATQPLQV